MIKAIERFKQLSVMHQYSAIQTVADQLLRVKECVGLSTTNMLDFIKDNQNFGLSQNEFHEAFGKIEKIANNFTKNRDQRKEATNTLRRR